METLILDEPDGNTVVLQKVVTRAGLGVEFTKALGGNDLQKMDQGKTVLEVSLEVLYLHAPLCKELVDPPCESLKVGQLEFVQGEGGFFVCLFWGNDFLLSYTVRKGERKQLLYLLLYIHPRPVNLRFCSVSHGLARMKCSSCKWVLLLVDCYSESNTKAQHNLSKI